ncbi:exopolyphosphatase-like protein [Nemania abortiva]|nr:exopolyphosphatase-like protein [Nemania abortiva]
MPPRASLKTFLATARAALTAPPSKRPTPLTFVVGNESADLDSLCSALLLAYFHTYAPPKRQSSIGDGSAAELTSTLHIPVCHLHRADLALRPEFTAVLHDAGVRGEDMFTLEDVLPREHQEASEETSTSINPEDTRWLLVDHNAMAGALANAFTSQVIGCVDHHADEGVIPRDADIRVIEKSGSCASLVLERCADGWEALSGLSPPQNRNGTRNTSEGEEVLEGAKIDAQLARLALAPILIDTTNLTDGSKTTAHDEVAVAIAEAKIAVYSRLTRTGGERAGVEVQEVKEEYDRTALFTRLSALKEDIAEMSFRDVFRKDYKEWGVGGLNLGTSSVPQGFQYLVERKAGGDVAAFISELQSWGAEKDAAAARGQSQQRERMDLIVLLTTFQDGEGRFSRELLVWARSEAGVRAARLFEDRCRDKLGLETWGDGVLDSARDAEGESEWRRCWVQRAVEHSRKQIAPMLRDALKEVS